MLVVKLIGGLGNQMHQYACGRALSLFYDQDLYLDTTQFHDDIRTFELDVFNIQAQVATTKEIPWYQHAFKQPRVNKLFYPIQWVAKKINPHHLIENPQHPRVHTAMFDFQPRVFDLKIKNYVYLEGFWHSEKYFKAYADIIRQDFTLKIPIRDEINLALIQKMQATNAVSLHVRRSDYLGSHYEGICNIPYYQKAIASMQAQIQHATFFVFSDDIAWCKQHLPLQHATFIDRNTGKDSYKDMILMSCCKHHIIANSTFSRRGARLNSHPDTLVIAPHKRHNHLSYADMIPQSWIRL